MPFREDLILKEFSENREKKEISEDDIIFKGRLNYFLGRNEYIFKREIIFI